MATSKKAAPKTDALNLTKRGLKKTDTLAEAMKAEVKRTLPAAMKRAATKAPAKATRKSALTVLSEQTVAKRAAAKKAPARAVEPAPIDAIRIKTSTRTAAEKRADPAPKVKPAFALHEVKNIGQLVKILSTTYPTSATWQSEFHFGVNYINVFNNRGRKIAEIKQVAK